MDYGLDGKIAWITGAGGALGASIAGALAAQGCVTVLTGRTRPSLEQTARAIGEGGGKPADIVPADLSRRDDVDRAAAQILQRHGRIDILVNSVALSTFGDFLELTDDDWETVLQAKFMGYMRTLRAVLPAMVKQRYGRIVNISGRGGRQPTPAHLPGCSANAAVHVLTKGLSDIYAKHNIRINAVAPGPIESERFDKIAASTDAVTAGVAASTRAPHIVPIGRKGLPQEIADAVTYLLSDRAGYITGTIQAVDGGGTVSI